MLLLSRRPESLLQAPLSFTAIRVCGRVPVRVSARLPSKVLIRVTLAGSYQVHINFLRYSGSLRAPCVARLHTQRLLEYTSRLTLNTIHPKPDKGSVYQGTAPPTTQSSKSIRGVVVIQSMYLALLLGVWV